MVKKTAKRKLDFSTPARKKAKVKRMRRAAKQRGTTFNRKIVIQPPAVTLADISFGQAFKLNMLDGVNDITALYDQYCIKGIGYRFRLRRYTDTSGAQLISQTLPIYHRVDLDDAGTPTIGNMRECENLVIDYLSDSNPVSKWYNFSPRVAQAVYAQGGLFNGYAMGKKNQWVDNSSPGVEHYGLKVYAIADGSGTQTWAFEMEIRFTIGARNVI